MTLNVGDFLLTGTPHGVGPIKVINYNYYLLLKYIKLIYQLIKNKGD